MSPRVSLELAPIDPERRRLEVVERKGPGHPDTLCDAAAEAFSRRLSRVYLEHTGRILHHNVDKALLVAGRTEVAFGGGRWLEPIALTLAGRATGRVDGHELPLEAIAGDAVREAFAAVRDLDPDDPAQLALRVAVRPGAAELREVFDEGTRGVPRSGDTSIGVGFAPASRSETLARRLAERLAERSSAAASPVGEDTKVMVVREGGSLRVTLAVAMRARAVPDADAYRRAVEEVRALALEEATRLGFREASVHVNAADLPGGSAYLTLSGTSAECGDDGQVGRGNRLGGLITPMRPMTLEAYAGKNPATHVGKLLSLAAGRAAAACAALPGVRAAECVLVSRIGAPVSEPQVAGVRLDADAAAEADAAAGVERIVAEQCAALPELWREILGAAPPEPA